MGLLNSLWQQFDRRVDATLLYRRAYLNDPWWFNRVRTVVSEIIRKSASVTSSGFLSLIYLGYLSNSGVEQVCYRPKKLERLNQLLKVLSRVVNIVVKSFNLSIATERTFFCRIYTAWCERLKEQYLVMAHLEMEFLYRSKPTVGSGSISITWNTWKKSLYKRTEMQKIVFIYRMCAIKKYPK